MVAGLNLDLTNKISIFSGYSIGTNKFSDGIEIGGLITLTGFIEQLNIPLGVVFIGGYNSSFRRPIIGIGLGFYPNYW